MINQFNQNSEIKRALDRENFSYYRMLAYQTTIQTFLPGRNTNVTSSSEDVVSRTSNAVNDEEDSSESSEVPVTGSIMNEE